MVAWQLSLRQHTENGSAAAAIITSIAILMMLIALLVASTTACAETSDTKSEYNVTVVLVKASKQNDLLDYTVDVCEEIPLNSDEPALDFADTRALSTMSSTPRSITLTVNIDKGDYNKNINQTLYYANLGVYNNVLLLHFDKKEIHSTQGTYTLQPINIETYIAISPYLRNETAKLSEEIGNKIQEALQGSPGESSNKAPMLEKVTITFSYPSIWRVAEMAGIKLNFAVKKSNINSIIDSIENVLSNVENDVITLFDRTRETFKDRVSILQNSIESRAEELKESVCSDAKDKAENDFDNVVSVECTSIEYKILTDITSIAEDIDSSLSEFINSEQDRFENVYTNSMNGLIEDIRNMYYHIVIYGASGTANIGAKVTVDGKSSIAAVESPLINIFYLYEPYTGSPPSQIELNGIEGAEDYAYSALSRISKKVIIGESGNYKQSLLYAKLVQAAQKITSDQGNLLYNDFPILVSLNTISGIDYETLAERLYNYVTSVIKDTIGRREMQNGVGLAVSTNFYNENIYLVFRGANSASDGFLMNASKVKKNKDNDQKLKLISNITLKTEEKGNAFVVEYTFKYSSKEVDAQEAANNGYVVPVGIYVNTFPSPAIRYKYVQSVSGTDYKKIVNNSQTLNKEYNVDVEYTVTVKVTTKTCDGENCTTESFTKTYVIRKRITVKLSATSSYNIQLVVHIYTIDKAEIDIGIGSIKVDMKLTSLTVKVDNDKIKKKLEEQLKNLGGSLQEYLKNVVGGPYILVAGPAPLPGSGLIDALSGRLYQAGTIFNISALLELSDGIAQLESDTNMISKFIGYIGIPSYAPVVSAFDTNIKLGDTIDKYKEMFRTLHVLPGEYIGATLVKGYTFDLSGGNKLYQALLNVLEGLNIAFTVVYQTVHIEYNGAEGILTTDNNNLKISDATDFEFKTLVFGIGMIKNVGTMIYSLPSFRAEDTSMKDAGPQVGDGTFKEILTKVLEYIGEQVSRLKLHATAYIKIAGTSNLEAKPIKLVSFITISHGSKIDRFIAGSDGTLKAYVDKTVVVYVAFVFGVPVVAVIDLNPSQAKVSQGEINVNVIDAVEVVPLLSRLDPMKGCLEIYAVPTLWERDQNGIYMPVGLPLLKGAYRPFDTRILLGYKMALVDDHGEIVGEPAVINDLGVSFEPIRVPLDELEPGRYRLVLLSPENKPIPDVPGYDFNVLYFERPKPLVVRFEEDLSARWTKLLALMYRGAEKAPIDYVTESVEPYLDKVRKGVASGDTAGGLLKAAYGSIVDTARDDLKNIAIRALYDEARREKGIDADDWAPEYGEDDFNKLSSDLLSYYSSTVKNTVENIRNQLLSPTTIENLATDISKKIVENLIVNAVTKIVTSALLPPPLSGALSRLINNAVAELDYNNNKKLSSIVTDAVAEAFKDNVVSIVEDNVAAAVHDMMYYTVTRVSEFMVNKFFVTYGDAIEDIVKFVNQQDVRDTLVLALSTLYVKGRPVVFWQAADSEGRLGVVEFPRLADGQSVAVIGARLAAPYSKEYIFYPLPLITSVARLTSSIIEGNDYSLDKAMSSIYELETLKAGPVYVVHVHGILVGAASILETLPLPSDKKEDIDKVASVLVYAASKWLEKLKEFESPSGIAISLYDLGNRVGLPTTVDTLDTARAIIRLAK